MIIGDEAILRYASGLNSYYRTRLLVASSPKYNHP